MSTANEEIVLEGAAYWKKRALQLEEKLHNYRKLLVYIDAVVHAKNAISTEGSSRRASLIEAIDELADESRIVDHVEDEGLDLFSQKDIDLVDGAQLTIQKVTGLGTSSEFDFETSTISIDADQPLEGKVIGLVFQLLQIADVGASISMKVPQALDSERLHAMTPVLISLLAATGFLNSAVGVTAKSIVEHCEAMRRAASADA